MTATLHLKDMRELLGNIFDALPESRKDEFREAVSLAMQAPCVRCAPAPDEADDANVLWYKRPVPQSMRARIAAVCAAPDGAIVAAANEFMDWYDAISLVRCNGVPVRG